MNCLEFVGLQPNLVTHQAVFFFFFLDKRRLCNSKSSTLPKSNHGECDKTFSAAPQFECHSEADLKFSEGHDSPLPNFPVHYESDIRPATNKNTD